MNIRDYRNAAKELRDTTTAYRSMMGEWLVATSKWKAENLDRYTWVLPPGNFIIPYGKSITIGRRATVYGKGNVTVIRDGVTPLLDLQKGEPSRDDIATAQGFAFTKS